ncbi:hypothetical protein PENTCL1PPCAC_21544, partial [Pristionchus entomophagus]
SMRLLLISTLALFTVVSALKCYEGHVPSANSEKAPKPKLTECEPNEKCCERSWVWKGGDTYTCQSTCPDFKGKKEIAKAKNV